MLRIRIDEIMSAKSESATMNRGAYRNFHAAVQITAAFADSATTDVLPCTLRLCLVGRIDVLLLASSVMPCRLSTTYVSTDILYCAFRSVPPLLPLFLRRLPPTRPWWVDMHGP